MKQLIKREIRKLVRRTGFDLVRHSRPREGRKVLGLSAFSDMSQFLEGIQEPTILDVGANTGQSAKRFLSDFPNSNIHSFEPSPTTFEELSKNLQPHEKVNCWNCGVGSKDDNLSFIENDHSDMSSFLAPSSTAWGSVVNKTEIDVVSLDSFTASNKIDYIHILKSDTQGYDFEVFKGAEELMAEDRIALIYFEFIFSDMYQDLPSFDEVFRHLVDRNFSLVTFYQFHHQKQLAGWTDMLFINNSFYEKRALNQ